MWTTSSCSSASTRPTVTDRQNCGNILAGVGPFAVERGLVPAGDARDQRADPHGQLRQHRRRHVRDPGRAGGVPRRHRDRRRPGTAAPIVLAFADTDGSATGALLPTGHVRDTVAGIEVTCVDNGMPVVLALADVRAHRVRAARGPGGGHGAARRLDAIRLKAAQLMGLGDVAGATVPKTVLLAPRPATAGRSCTRTFIPVQLHTSIGVLGAVSVAPGCCSRGRSGTSCRRTGRGTPRRSTSSTRPGTCSSTSSSTAASTPPRVVRSGVVRTARKLFDGTVVPARPEPSLHPSRRTAVPPLARHRAPRPRRAAHPQAGGEPRLLRPLPRA